MVLGRRATSQHLRRVRGSAGSGGDPDPGLARGPRDHAGWAARWAGASALTDQHPGPRARPVVGVAHGRGCGTPWTRSTASDTPQSRRTRLPCSARRARVHADRGRRDHPSSPSMSARSVPARADRPASRPVRGRVARHPSRSGTGAGATPRLGCPRLGRQPAGQGHPCRGSPAAAALAARTVGARLPRFAPVRSGCRAAGR